MTSHPLDYARIPPPLQRWARRLAAAGIVVVSNVVAAISTIVILLAAGLLTRAVLGVVCVFSGEYQGFFETAAGLVIMAVVLAIAFAVLALLLAPLIIITGITADAVRRSCRGPWWTGFPAVMFLSFCLTFNALAGHRFLWTLLGSALGAVTLTAIFCIYWIPLGCTESILRLARWSATRFFEWRHQRKLEKRDALAISPTAAPPEISSAAAPISADKSAMGRIPSGDAQKGNP